MKIFEERERAIEAEWARRAEIGTRIRARRHRYFAEWAAAEAGLTGDAAAARAREYVKLDFRPDGEAAILERAAADLGRTSEMLQPEMDRFGRQADTELRG